MEGKPNLFNDTKKQERNQITGGRVHGELSSKRESFNPQARRKPTKPE